MDGWNISLYFISLDNTIAFAVFIIYIVIKEMKNHEVLKHT